VFNVSEQEKVLEKLMTQNLKLKKEFEELKVQLSNCLSKVKTKQLPIEAKVEKTEEELIAEKRTRKAAHQIEYYKGQIKTMKNYIENSFNIDK
jgi:hypothetical protein